MATITANFRRGCNSPQAIIFLHYALELISFESDTLPANINRVPLCFYHKAEQTPAEAGMTLASHLHRPSGRPAESFAVHLKRYREWTPFISGWQQKRNTSLAAVD